MTWGTGRHAAISAFAAVLTCIAVAGCDNGGLPTLSGPLNTSGVAHTWVGSDATSVDLVQLTENGVQLSGTIDETDLPVGETTTTSHQAGFTGTLDGTALTLSIQEGLGTNLSASGTLTATTLTLNSPSSDGTISTLTLKPSTVDGFNAAVAKLQAAASSALAEQQQASATAAQSQATSEQQQAIDSDAQSVTSDYNALQTALNQGIDFSAFGRDLATARTDLQRAKADAASAQALGQGGDGCATAGTAGADAGTVQADDGTIQADNGTLQSALAPISDDVTVLKTAWSNFQQAQALQPTYATQLPSAAEVSTIEAKAGQDIAHWNTQGQQYQSSADTLAKQAQTVADAAQAAVC